MSIETGSFTKSTNTSTPVSQDVTLPFDPKSVILFANQATSANTIQENDLVMAIGASDGTTEKSVHIHDEDGQGTSDTGRVSNSTKGIAFYDPADGSLLAEGDITMGSGKFTVTWTTNNATAYIIGYFATTLSSEVGSFTQSGTAPNTQTISTTNVGKGIMIWSAYNTSEDTEQSDAYLSIGFADGTNEAVNVLNCVDGSGTSSTSKRFSTDEVAQLQETATGILAEGSFGGFNTGPNGFDIDWGADNATAYIYRYIMFYEGTWEAGSGTARTTTGTKAFTTTNQPDAVLLTTSLSPSLDTSSTSAAMSLGASDGTNDTLACATSKGGVSTTITRRALYNTDCIGALASNSSTFNYRARLDSFNATDFTMDFQDAGGVARYFGWLAVKDEAAPVGGAVAGSLSLLGVGI